jgi:multicomponent Na+:H+ antiporter subunit G
MNLINIVGIVTISLGIFFLMIGSIGLLRLPDFYSRAHATGKSDTLGLMMVFLGLIIIEGLHINSLKILLVMIFVGFTSPTATNAIMRAAFRFRLKPWFTKDQEKKDR